LSCGIYGPMPEHHRKQWDSVRQLLFSTSEAFYLDIRFKVLYFVADEVTGALSMLEALLTIQIVCGTHRSDSLVRAS
jgi:hypothetical protein